MQLRVGLVTGSLVVWACVYQVSCEHHVSQAALVCQTWASVSVWLVHRIQRALVMPDVYKLYLARAGIVCRYLSRYLGVPMQQAAL